MEVYLLSNRLESPTRTLTLEAPKGVEVNAGVGEFKASCRKDLTLESSEGEVSMSVVYWGNLDMVKRSSLNFFIDGQKVSWSIVNGVTQNMLWQ